MRYQEIFFEAKHIFDMEIQHLRGILLEDRLDFLRNKYIPLIKSYVRKWTMKNDPAAGPPARILNDEYSNLLYILRQQNPNVPSTIIWDTNGRPKINDTIISMIFNWILSLDPNVHKRNTQWLLDTFLKGAWIPEDGYKATNMLAVYDRVKSRLPVEQRDLRYFKDFPSLFVAIQPFEYQQSKRAIDKVQDEAMHQQAEVIYNGSDYKVIVPKTKEAACYFGVHTQWCTAATDSYNAFDTYNRSGPLYIILDKKNNRRWQFHLETEQFMDETDSPIEKRSFARQHPKVLEILLPIVLKALHAELLPVTFQGKLVAKGPMMRARNFVEPSDEPDWRLLKYRVFDNIFNIDDPTISIIVDNKPNERGVRRISFARPEDRIAVHPRMWGQFAGPIANLLNELGVQGFSMRETSELIQKYLIWEDGKFIANPRYWPPIVTGLRQL
jgi:hypothetical protein